MGQVVREDVLEEAVLSWRSDAENWIKKMSDYTKTSHTLEYSSPMKNEILPFVTI